MGIRRIENLSSITPKGRNNKEEEESGWNRRVDEVKGKGKRKQGRYSSPTPARASATRMRRKIATAQSHSLRVITKTGTAGSFSRVRWSWRRREDMLRKLATETTSREAAVSRFIVAWFCVAW
jgi:hypothetical protein